MKERILELRAEGKTYSEIMGILKCSKSTISYYCGEGQKEKTKNRINKRRENILLNKVERFKYRKHDSEPLNKHNKDRKDVVESIRKFQKTDINFKNDRVNKIIKPTFTWEDVLEKYGENTNCYLSGEMLNLYENEYQLDHKIPASKGGNNTLNNLGITHKVVNQMKGDLTPDELINWCIKILKYNGYNITK